MLTTLGHLKTLCVEYYEFVYWIFLELMCGEMLKGRSIERKMLSYCHCLLCKDIIFMFLKWMLRLLWMLRATGRTVLSCIMRMHNRLSRSLSLQNDHFKSTSLFVRHIYRNRDMVRVQQFIRKLKTTPTQMMFLNLCSLQSDKKVMQSDKILFRNY